MSYLIPCRSLIDLFIPSMDTEIDNEDYYTGFYEVSSDQNNL